MALNIHCLFSDGYSERGGMYPFLKKWNDRVNWIQVFPSNVKEKPGAKPGAEPGAPTGASGKNFIARAKRNLTMQSTIKGIHDNDYILLVDDADCRFDCYEDALETQAALEQEFKALVGKDIRLRLLLASPEVEAWFYADWRGAISPLINEQLRRSLGREDPRRVMVLAVIRRRLRDVLMEHGYASFTPERFGMPYDQQRGTCTIKFSSFLQTALDRALVYIHKRKIMIDPPRLMYKKDAHGGMLLREIRPGVVAEMCKQFYAPVYEELSKLT